MKSKIEKWKILSSSYISNEDWCTIRVDHVQLPSGAEIPNYYVYEYPNWVNVIGITKEKQFLLVRQYRHGLRQVDYELVAGVCDNTDKNPMETAKRELLEETGYGNGTWKEFTIISANPGTHNNLCYCFLATDIKKIAEQHLEETEDLEVILMSLDELKNILLEDNIKQAAHATPLWKYLAINNLL